MNATNRTKNTKFVASTVIIAIALLLSGCGSMKQVISIAQTAIAPTPLPLTGCNAIELNDGTLGFYDEDRPNGNLVTLTSDQVYIAEPEFFAFFRAECIQGLLKVTLSIADVRCVNENGDPSVTWEADGGWSCYLPDGSWTFQMGGGPGINGYPQVLWPHGGPPEGYVEPTPIFPGIPTPSDPNGQNG